MSKDTVADWDPIAANNTDVGGVAITGASSVRLGNDAIQTMMAQIATLKPVGVLKGHIYGLTLSNNTGDATNDIDIAAGEAASTETNPVLMVLASALTKRLDASWAVGSGNGGLDTGSIANTTYHIWLIQRSDTGVVDALFSTSASSPTMPTNYDRKRRIGSIIRSGGAILAFTQSGDEFALNTGASDVDVTTPGTSAVTRTVTVPSGIIVEAFGHIGIANSSNANGHLLSSLSVADQAVSGSNPGLPPVRAPASSVAAGPWRARTNASAQIRSRNESSAADVIRITTRGWIDTRGRDA